MKKTRIGLLLSILLVFAVFSLSFGVVYISPTETFHHVWDIITQNDTVNINRDIIQYLRLPHILLSFFIGAGLALTGTVMQAVVKNPLADPYLLGISSGAGLGAVLSIVFGITGLLGIYGIGIFAFLGAIFTSITILLITSIIGKHGTLSLILVGFAVNSICAGLISFIIMLVSDPRQTQTIQFWLMGNISIDNFYTIGILSLLIIFGTLFFFKQSRILDLMLMGDELSITMGRNLSTYRKWYILIVSFLVGSIVYMTGIIGFVGLLIPHAVRQFTGSGHKKLIPFAALTGGIFLVWADVIGRSAIPGLELPIGVFTAVFGAPLFVWMLLNGNYGGKR